MFHCHLPPFSTITSPKHNQIALLKILAITSVPSKNIHWPPVPHGKMFSGAWTQKSPQYDHYRLKTDSFQSGYLLVSYCKTISSKMNLSTIFHPLCFVCWSACDFTCLFPPLHHTLCHLFQNISSPTSSKTFLTSLRNYFLFKILYSTKKCNTKLLTI